MFTSGIQRRPLALICVLLLISQFAISGAALGSESTLIAAKKRPADVAPSISKPAAIKVEDEEFSFKYKLSKDAEQPAEKAEKEHSVKGSALTDVEADEILAQLPQLKVESGLPVFIRPKTPVPAPPGKNIDQKFPPEEKLAPPAESSKVDALKVLRTSPNGDVNSANKITITFSQAMVPLASQGELAQMPAYVSNVEGEWRWVGTQTMMFVPKAGQFPMSSKFDVAVKGGLKSQNGGVLAHDASFNFSTATVKVVSSNAVLPQGWQNPVSTNPLIYFTFNQKINPAEIAKHIKFKSGASVWTADLVDKETALKDDAIKPAIEKLDSNTYVVVRPHSELPTAHDINIELGPNLPSAEGPILSPKSETYSIKTYSKFAYERLHTYNSGFRSQPSVSWQVEFNQQIQTSNADLQKLVTVDPPLQDQQITAVASTIAITGSAPGGSKHKITVKAALEDTFKQHLSGDVSITGEVPHLNKMVVTPPRFMVLAPGSKLQHLINSVNLHSCHVEVFQVEPSDWTSFISNNWGYERTYNTPLTIKTTPWKKIFEKELELKSVEDAVSSNAVDLSSFIKNGQGNLVLRVSYATDQNNFNSYSTWVEATDLAIDTFTDKENALVWVSSLSSGKPIEGASVTFNDNESTLKTDKNGLAKAQLHDQGGSQLIVTSGSSKAFLPSGMWNYASWRRNNYRDQINWYSVTDRKLYKPGEKLNVKGWLRKMESIPTGDLSFAADHKTVHYEVMDGHYAKIAEGNAEVNAAGGFDFSCALPSECNTGYGHINLQSGNSFSNLEYQIGEFRRPEFELTLKDMGPSTHFIGDHGTVQASTNYFSGGSLPNTKISWSASPSPAPFSPPGWSGYSFGRSTSVYPIFHYGRSFRPKPNGVNSTQSLEGKTDDNGQFLLRTDFESVAPAQPVNLNLSASVQDVNRQTWTSNTTVLIHPSSYYVGIKTDKMYLQKGDNFKGKLVVCDIDGKPVANAQVQLSLQTQKWNSTENKYEYLELKNETLPFASKPLTFDYPLDTKDQVRLIAKVKDEKGRINETLVSAWMYGAQNEQVKTAGKENVTLMADKKEYAPGETAKILVQSPFARAHGLMIVRRSGILSSSTFEMDGETTTLSLPITDQLLPNASVEIDLIENRDGKSTGVALIAGGESEFKVSTERRKITINVNPEAATLLPGAQSFIEVSMKDHDGNPIKDSDAVVAVVDESVLALTGYTFGDPLLSMYPTRAPEVQGFFLTPYVLVPKQDADSNDSKGPGGAGSGGGAGGGWSSGPVSLMGATNGTIAPASPRAASYAPGHAKGFALNMRKQEGSGFNNAAQVANMGDALQEADGASAKDGGNPFNLRTDFAALALFEPSAHTNAEGKIKLPLKLPDSTSRYRIMVAAASGERLFGFGESTVVAQLPLTIKPSAPRFLNLADTFELPIVLQNMTASPISAKVAVRSNKVNFPQGHGRIVEIAANDRVELRIPAEATDVGKAQFQVAAIDSKSSKTRDANSFTLPIYTPATSESFATYGNTTADGAIAQSIKIPTDVFPQIGDLKVSTSSTALQTLTDAFIYLYEYPFACTEQLSSRILAIDSLSVMLSAMNADGLPKPEKIKAEVNDDLAAIAKRQRSNGGFRLWDSEYSESEYPFASVHAAHAIERAIKAGNTFDANQRRRYQDYLSRIESFIPHYKDDPGSTWSIRAYAIYVRNLYEPDRAWDAALDLAKELDYEKAPLEVFGWLLPVLTQKQNAELTKIRQYLNNHVEETAGKAEFVRHGERRYSYLTYWSNSREDAVLLDGMIADQPNSDLIQKLLKNLTAHKKAGRWNNTQENAFVILAMRKYFEKYENVKPDFIARAWLGADYLGEHKFSGYNADNYDISVPMSFLSKIDPNNKIILSKSGPGRMYYRLALNYAPKNLLLKPMDRGFVIGRSYEAVGDKDDVQKLPDGTWKIKAGSKVRVRISFSVPASRHHVALVDPLPAGLEPINPDLRGNSGSDDESHDPIPLMDYGIVHRPWFWYWAPRWYEHQNLRDERAEAFATTIYDGDYNYTYDAHATTPGTFTAAPTKVEEMYEPETFGRGQTDKVIVTSE